MNIQRSELLANLVVLTREKSKYENISFVELSRLMELNKEYIQLSEVLDYLWNLDLNADNDEDIISKMNYLLNVIIFKYSYFIELTKERNPRQDLSQYTFFNLLNVYLTPQEEMTFDIDDIKNIAKILDLLVDKFNGKLEKLLEKDLLDNDAALFLATKLDTYVMTQKMNISEQIKNGII
jgi:hypothetical protein